MLFAAIVASILVAIVVAISNQGVDRSVTGRATAVEQHRLCVTAGGDEQCAQVDQPARVRRVRLGACVEVRRSGSSVLESVVPATGCR